MDIPLEDAQKKLDKALKRNLENRAEVVEVVETKPEETTQITK